MLLGNAGDGDEIIACEINFCRQSLRFGIEEGVLGDSPQRLLQRCRCKEQPFVGVRPLAWICG